MRYNVVMNKIQKTALVDALLTTAYIILVGGFFYFGTLLKIGRNNTFLAPIVMLLLFVFSAALTGYLMFGKPALWYVDGKKKEALSLLSYTLTFFCVITLLAVVLLIVFTR